MLMERCGIYRDVPEENMELFSSKGYKLADDSNEMAEVEECTDKDLQAVDFSKMTISQLEEYALEHDIDISETNTKAEKIDLLKAMAL